MKWVCCRMTALLRPLPVLGLGKGCPRSDRNRDEPLPCHPRSSDSQEIVVGVVLSGRVVTVRLRSELVNVDANGRDGERVGASPRASLIDSDLRLLTNAVGRIKTLRGHLQSVDGRPRARRKH